MTRPRLARLLCLLLLLPAAATAGEARFMTQPDVRGERIVFAYEGDLYLAGVEGGTPVRLTSHPAGELAPKFSPDGRWIAYTTSRSGVLDVWVMPAEGGTPKRLTWPPLGGQVVAWTPDSQRVVFRSAWGTTPVSRDQKLYTVSLDASLPVALPPDRGMNASFSPDGSKLLYVRKGDESYYWKRYKGGRYPDVWLYDFGARSFKPVTDYVGRNGFPMWIAPATMLFTSDRGSDGVTNLWAQDLAGGGAARQVTTFGDFDVMTPSSDGRRVVFVQNGYLWLMDAAGGAPRRLTLRIPSDDWRLEERFVNPSDQLQFVDVGNDGRTVALGARGDVFSVTLAEKEKDKEASPRNLTRTPGVREDYPRLSPDGSRVAYFADATGEYQLYLRDLKTGEQTQLTSDLDRKVYHPHWSPDGKKLLFGDKDFALWLLDVATRKRTKLDEWHRLDNDEFTWEVSDYAWSPDSRWVAYSSTSENRNNVITLYDTLEGRKVALTGDFYDNFNPRFDADGGYLYFLSHRNFEIAMDPFEDDHIVARPTRVMAVALRKGERPPFARRPADEPAAPAADPKPGDAERFRVDPEGIGSRVYPLPVEPGNYFHLLAGKGHVAWSSVPEFSEEEFDESYRPAGRTKWTLHVFSLADEKEVALDEKIAEAEVSASGEQLVVRKESAVHVTKLAKAYESKKLGREVDLSGLVYRVSPREEWRQIFADAWRWYRDFFYDPEMHGRDWKAVREKYRPYVEEIRTRQQLNWVLSEMVGELCVSHTYVSGGDTGPSVAPPDPAVRAGLLGADLEADAKSGRYRFARIYGPTPYFTDIETPLARPDVDVKPGDYLLAIDGQPLRVPENYFRLLQVGKGDSVALTVGSSPSDPAPRTFRVRPVRSDREARYARWVSDNVDETLRLSNGEVGYMHVTAMGGEGILQFDKFWRAFRYKKGLVVDVRGNGGGWTEYFMIDKLERQQVAFNVLKGMEAYRYPNPASRAQFVVLSNEDNGSDGEAFVEHFKARQLGTVVGVPSWGGLVGVVNGQRTLDGGRVEQSNNAFFGREGKWLVENHGALPDVLQDNDPGSAAEGRDAQLERAVAVALQKIREKPWTFPERPAYPKP